MRFAARQMHCAQNAVMLRFSAEPLPGIKQRNLRKANNTLIKSTKQTAKCVTAHIFCDLQAI